MSDLVSPRIRSASLADLPRLAGGNVSHLRLLHERMVRRLRGAGELLLAELDGQPVGHIYIWTELADEEELRRQLRGVPLLMNLWVHKSFRRRGIGRSLVDAAESWLAREGHKRVALGVETDNQPAINLYYDAEYYPWPYEDLKTHYDKFHPDGTHEVLWETCAVYIKELVPVEVKPQPAESPGTVGGLRPFNLRWLRVNEPITIMCAELPRTTIQRITPTAPMDPGHEWYRVNDLDSLLGLRECVKTPTPLAAMLPARMAASHTGHLVLVGKRDWTEANQFLKELCQKTDRARDVSVGPDICTEMYERAMRTLTVPSGPERDVRFVRGRFDAMPVTSIRG